MVFYSKVSRYYNKAESIDSKSLQAIRNNNFLEWLLAQGVNIQTQLRYLLNKTALFIICSARGNYEGYHKTLIAAGADVFRGDLLHSAA